MAKVDNTPITDLKTSWEDKAGEQVEAFLKDQLSSLLEKSDNLGIEKGSYLALLNVDEATNIASVGIFASNETYTKWYKDKDANADLLLSSVEIPMGSGSSSTEASYILKLTNMGSKAITATSKDDLKARVRFTSQLYDPSDKSMSNTNENARLQIETRMQDASEWKVAGSITIQSQPTEDASAYTEIDLSPYCVSGTQSVRMIAIGEVSEKKTSYVNITVTLTNIQITFQTKWQNPFVYRANASTIQVPVLVTGNISKVLHFNVTSADGKYTRDYEYNLGTATYTETPFSASIDHPQAHGLYTIKAWITSGNAVSTAPVSQSIMCTMPDVTTPLLVINNVGTFQNWSRVSAFEYAIYNPNQDSTDITFTLNNSETEAVLYTETVYGVQDGTVNTLIFDLEIETSDNVSFPANMTFTSGETVLRSPLALVVDNSENFAPVSGADFFLNPKARNNSEANAETIINAMNGQEVNSTFNGLSFVSDGWLIDENTNARCLRLLDGESINIDYDAYSDGTALQGLTIEVDFATRNVTDESKTLLQMGTQSTTDKYLVGFWLKAQESCFMSSQKRSEGAQNWIYSKERRTHVAINIVPNLYNQGVNYVRVFINGIISREFVYADNDSFWQSVGGTKKTGGIVIAPEGADLDIYGLRIYKKSMSATDIRQNYLSSLASVDEKKAFKEANNILGESGLISYVKAYEKYNTLLYKGTVPSLSAQGSTVGDVVIHKIGDPEHSGTLYNMTRKGQGSTSKKYWTWNIQSDFKGDAETNYWKDENEVNHGQCYQNAAGLPMAKKLVDKRNWASSMQSHKLGATKLYNDVYQTVVGKNEITNQEGLENCRVAVYEDPFLVFQQESDDVEPTFIGMGTFGSGKADKPTFGYDKEKSPDMLMIEGSDNNPRLTKHQVPWIPGDVNYDEEEEGYVYAGTTSWDYDLGNQDTLPRFIEAFNFVYLNSNRLKPFIGTYTQLQAASEDLDRSYCYWVTRADDTTNTARYDMFCYNEITSSWVAGSTTKDSNGNYATLNVKEQLKSSLDSDFTNHEALLSWNDINEDFIKARKKVFAANIGKYFHKKDIMYFMCMMKLIGASDNRVKNTYLWVYDSTSLIRTFQDDLDSIMPVDNQGQLKKPYYVEEHDKDESTGKNYWNGEDNVLYNMMEECFATDLRSTMNEILSAMATLGGGTVQGCWEKYFLSTQQYFPAVAYNEMARIGYEYAHYQMENGNYNNDTDPITQSLGSQEEGERQWLSDRTIYMSSYAKYGEFNPSAPAGGNIMFRSIDSKAITYDLTMAMWLYPVATVGQSVILDGVRVKAGESISVTGLPADDTQSAVCGVNYMSAIGTWYDKPANGVFAFNGSRVKNLVAGTDNVDNIRLKATGVSVSSMKALRTLDVHNLSTLTGTLDVSKNTRLESLDARGTSITAVSLPSQEFLASVKLPTTMTELRLDGFKGLSELSLEGWNNIKTFYFNQATCPKLNAIDFIEKLREDTELNSLTVLGVDCTDVSLDVLNFLLDKQAKLTGRITLSESVAVDVNLKMRMLNLWGDIDSEENNLYITYTVVPITSVTVKGKKYMDATGTYQYQLSVNPNTGNNIKSVEWSIDKNDFAIIHPKTGIITIDKVGSEELEDKASVSVVLTLMDNSTLSTSKMAYFYKKTVALGDYIFNDASYSDELEDGLVPVAIVFYIEPTKREWVLAVSMRNSSKSYYWGLSTTLLPNIELKDSLNQGYSIYDVPTIDNISVVLNQALSDVNILDSDNPDNDGFKSYPSTHPLGNIGFSVITPSVYTLLSQYLDSLGLKIGDLISAGQLNTLKLLVHRNRILSDSNINLPIPNRTTNETELQNLEKCINNVVALHDYKYEQYYYSMASYCHAYEPNINNLDDKLKASHWFLASIGECARIVWYMIKSNSENEKYGIFTQAIVSGIFTYVNTMVSSSERYSNSYKMIYNNQLTWSNQTDDKSNKNVVRPVIALKIK